MAGETDYRKFYDDETYLLDAGSHFRETGQLDAADFYMLLMWKANRAKNYHRKRMKRQAGSFDAAVAAIAVDIHRAADGKGRLQVLMDKWLFALPTATAILALLYPDEFTVYDWRVCGELPGQSYKPWRAFSDGLWNSYQAFVRSVIQATPRGLSLRDKDRYLIGRSIRKELEQECMA
jgi:hypothetical protein